MSNKRPLRVLHIIDTLGGGGSERLIWDIVRLSDKTQIKHRVATIFPDGYLTPFVYAEPLRQLGAYGSISKQTIRTPSHSEKKQVSQPGEPGSGLVSPLISPLRKLPAGVKRPLATSFNAAFSRWQQIKRVFASYFPSAITIPREYFRFRPDIIHVHGFYGFKYGLLAKALFHRPMVHTVPCLFSQMEAQQTGWLADYYRRFHHQVDRFALDPGYRGELIGAGVPAEKLFDISGTLDLQKLARVKAETERFRVELRKRLNIPMDSLIALSVGRLDPTKGHSYTVEALPLMLEEHPNLHWVLLGEGADRAELETRIKDLKIEPHAHLIGFDPDPLPYYAAADIYLRTTTMEGENTSSQQAIAIGLPTVGFDTCRETDLIGKLGHGFIVPNGDAPALAAAACRILSLPDRGREMGALGVAYCNSTLGMQKHVDDLVAVYTELHRRRMPGREQVAGLTVDNR